LVIHYDNPEWPELTFPKEEGEYVKAAYERGNTILEYGSGGSTKLAAEMPGKRVFSVESDLLWAVRLQRRIDEIAKSPTYIHYVNIGRTGSYGRPINDEMWRHHYQYAASIWLLPFFSHPDVVLIDGRLRAACFLFAGLSITRPTTILFDDYAGRPAYHRIEHFAKPSELVGRMAVFELEQPIQASPMALACLLEFSGEMTYAGQPISYERS